MSDLAPSKAIIDPCAYAHNLAQVRRYIPSGCSLAPVVKADAYGHGAIPLARRAVQEGAALLCVATVPEALVLRDAGITVPILLLIQPNVAAIKTVVRHGLDVTLSDETFAQRLSEVASRLGREIAVHYKIDTGMGRQGIAPERAVEAMRQACGLPGLRLAGVATHLPVADVADDPQTVEQIHRFARLVGAIKETVAETQWVHAASSGAIGRYPASAFNLVRPGLMTYGVWPGLDRPPSLDLHPVLRWETTAVLVKDLPAGTTIGYGRTYALENPQRIAILPVGYADGYPTQLANRAEVLIHGVRRPVRGRISMDQIVVDVTQPPAVRPGDRAVLIGTDGDDAITVEELAHLAETIPYDILTGIGNRVERHYTE